MDSCDRILKEYVLHAREILLACDMISIGFPIFSLKLCSVLVYASKHVYCAQLGVTSMCFFGIHALQFQHARLWHGLSFVRYLVPHVDCFQRLKVTSCVLTVCTKLYSETLCSLTTTIFQDHRRWLARFSRVFLLLIMYKSWHSASGGVKIP